MSNNVIPVGLFRFLTPVDTVQVGDFGRGKGLTNDDINYAERNWSIVEKACLWRDGGGRILGKSIAELHEAWEFMRPIPGESTHAPDPRSE